MEEKEISKFTSYLYKIGLISPITLREFRNIYQSQDEATLQSTEVGLAEIYIRDKIVKTLIMYMNSLTDDKKKQISQLIFSQYKSNQQENQRKSLSRINKIYKRQALLPKFQIWRQKSRVIFTSMLQSSCSSHDLMKKTKVTPNPKIRNMAHSPRVTSLHNRSKISESSRARKEQEELSHCTFHPNINNTTFSQSRDTKDVTVHDRLYTDHKRMIERKNIRIIEKNNNLGKIATFKPNLISTSPKSMSNFQERMAEFNNKRNITMERIKSEVENNFKEKCSFSPDISASQKSRKIMQKNYSFCGKIPAYERLYKLNEVQRQNYLTKQNEIDNEIKKMACSPSMKNLKNKVDYRKIEELYNHYKEGKAKIEKKRNELYLEQGITFKPELYTNEKYYDRINPNFYEREKQFIQEKNNYISACHQVMEDYRNKQKLGYGKYTNKEKEQIAQNIVERLYVKGLEKKGITVINNSNYNYASNEEPTEEIGINENLQNNPNTYSVSQLPMAYNGDRLN